MSIALGLFCNLHLVHYKYSQSFSKLTFFKNLPFTIGGVFILLTPTNILMNPACQSINRSDMAPSTLEEETFKTLTEKTDIYDHIDAILELKDKHSLYELEQVSKEVRMRKNSVKVENFKKFQEIKNKA